MAEVRFPLAGDVSQVINPWTWATRWAENQFGLININLGRSSDPNVEQRILNDVGPYGKQLGRIGDALKVLLRHVDDEKLPDDERIAILLLKEQLREIDTIKGANRLNVAGNNSL